MADQRLLDLFDHIGANLKEVVAYKEELVLMGIKCKEPPAISHDPTPQDDLSKSDRYSPALTVFELSKYRKMCPSGWFTEKEFGDAICMPKHIERICFWLKRKSLIRFNPQLGKYRKAHTI